MIRGLARPAAWVVTAATGLALAGPAPAADAATSHAETLRHTVIALVDAARVTNGCKALRETADLDRSATSHATEMSADDYFSHSSADGTSWYIRLQSFGTKYPGGENIAMGYYSTASVMAAWLASPGHRANILDCQFKSVGVGQAPDGGYWVEDFAY
ncbi:MAG TPA: CAP domain-containing protein [Sporichthyaceae bacterium]|jgi:uncharacterized protein YkwD|nr:CAP domain-containing protein [Sporichthyaceae bacterium]